MAGDVNHLGRTLRSVVWTTLFMAIFLDALPWKKASEVSSRDSYIGSARVLDSWTETLITRIYIRQ